LKKNSILILTDWYDPGFKAGGPIQSCVNLVAALKDEFEIKILTSDTDFSDVLSYPNIKSNQWILQEGVLIYYVSRKYLLGFFPKQFLNQAETIYLNSMFSIRFTLLPLLFYKLGLINPKSIILAPRGMLGEGATLVKPFKKNLFLRISKLLGFYNNVKFHATRDQERLDIFKYFPNAEIQVIPNIPLQNAARKSVKKHKNELKLVSIARISIGKKTLYLIDLMAKISNMPNIVLDIYGSVNDQEYFEKCKRRAENLKNKIRLNFCAPIPHKQLMSKLSNYHFFILPTPGENYGHAIVESLSMGLPVIISDKTPWHFDDYPKAGWEIPLSDEPQFIEVLRKCHEMGNEEYQIMKTQAIDFSQKRINSEELINNYIQLVRTSI